MQKVATRAYNAVSVTLLAKWKTAFKKTGTVLTCRGQAKHGAVMGTGERGGLGRDETASHLSQEIRGQDCDCPRTQCPLEIRALVRRKLNGRNRFMCNWFVKGNPSKRSAIKLVKDWLAWTSGRPQLLSLHRPPNSLKLRQFCTELRKDQQKIRAVQRKLDRQRRAITS